MTAPNQAELSECDCGHAFSVCPRFWHRPDCAYKKNHVCLGFENITTDPEYPELRHLCEEPPQ